MLHQSEVLVWYASAGHQALICTNEESYGWGIYGRYA